jgi:hypothetical protein
MPPAFQLWNSTGIASTAFCYVEYVARQLKVSAPPGQWKIMKDFLSEWFDNNMNVKDPLNTAFCESDSDDPSIPEPPKIKRIPISVIWGSRLKAEKVPNIWA